MYRFIGWYNRNRKGIWVGIIAIIIIVGIVYYLLVEMTDDSSDSGTESSNIYEDLNNDLNSVTLTTEESVLTGDTATSSSEKLKTIDNFVEYCNNQDIENAYDLLSEECKEEMYQSLDNFQTNYYNSIFGGEKKSVNMENWIDNTYKVEFSDDILSSGVYSTEDVIQDYITIVKDDDDVYKLNINGFIGRSYSSSSNSNNGLTINVKEINTYMDYEIYTYEVVNDSGKNVVLCDLDTEYTTYLLDKNNVKYSAYLHELSDAQLKVNIGQTKNIEIKYYNKFSSSKDIKYVFFSNIVFTSDGEESSSCSITIDL